ncbi:hypothetical protein [Streptomyces sp. NPDC006012]|uniref:hypothetical protein n=1 Tax=Streptomyces sp. NPDC006012 TaxID=3364739 RepID=UPI0036CE264A
MGGTLEQWFPNAEGTSMSYPNQDGADFEIYTQPLPPPTARELVEQLGAEAVRDALPAAARRSFDRANPWSQIQSAQELYAHWMTELEILEQNIADQGYTRAEAQVLYQQAAERRQGLTEIASTIFNNYANNLINHIESLGLTQRVAHQTGLYSTPELSVSQAASLYPPDLGGNDDRRDPQGGRAPLGNNRGDRRQPRQRR